MRSWDSHAHYQDFPPDEDEDEDEDDVDVVDGVAGVPGGLFPSKSSIVCYCDMSTFKTPRTLLRVLLVVRKLNCDTYKEFSRKSLGKINKKNEFTL